jgi:hypothetical protein
MSKIEVNQISSQCGSTLTIGQSGDTVTLACGATQTGFGRTGTVDWCTTAKTAPFTGVSGKGYFVNTSCGAITVTLPATPTAGDIISIKDYARTAGTNAINFCRNGSKMDGTCSNSSIITNGESTTLIYVDGTKGWTSILDSTTTQYGAAYVTATGGTITCCGNYRIHTFTSSGTFTVCSTGNAAGSNSVDYLVVAGGGGSGGDTGGGGGGGGFRESHTAPVSGCYTASPLASSTPIPVSATTYPITVGAGGAAGVPLNYIGCSGSNSIFSTITSAGGGGGGGGYTPSCYNGRDGGSGGGGSRKGGVGGTGNTPPTTPAQGFSGGTGQPGGTCTTAGGGGGATAIGTNGTTTPGPSTGFSVGGAGAGTNINTATGESGPGPLRYYSGGGGGALRANSTPTTSVGGIGGGGDGGPGCQTAGTTNTGGGGGGGSAATNGGSGIVIIRYKYQN